jgi:membrane protein implicated in regulation of membrane protease activity
MMEPLFSQFTHWHWWTLALILLVLEVFVPGTFFLWMGISAMFTGLLALVFSISWEVQFLLFAILSIVSVSLGRAYIKKRPIESDQPNLNRRGAQYVGRTFTLSEPIVHGYGKIRVDDSSWKIEGNDTPAGSQVKVVGVDGVVLKVERI